MLRAQAEHNAVFEGIFAQAIEPVQAILTQVVGLIDGLRLNETDGDSKGDLFEYVLKQVKQAGERGTMVNFTFHGIGGDHLSVSKEAHEELLRFLAANRKQYWTDTFLNIMKHVRREQRR